MLSLDKRLHHLASILHSSDTFFRLCWVFVAFFLIERIDVIIFFTFFVIHSLGCILYFENPDRFRELGLCIKSILAHKYLNKLSTKKKKRDERTSKA